MPFLSIEIEQLLLKKYKQTTIKTINANIKRIFRDVFESNNFELHKLFEFTVIKTYLDALNNVSVKKTLTNNIVAVLSIIVGVPKNTLEKYK